MKVCIIGASGKLGQYMVQNALYRGYEVVGVCRPRSVGKLEKFKGRIKVIPGATNDREVIKKAVAGCDGVLTVLVPWGANHYATGTAQAVLDYAQPDARLAVLLEFKHRRRHRKVLLVGRHAREPLPAANRVRQFLLEPCLQSRLVVEQIKLRRRAGLRQPDDAPGARREMRQHRLR